ncbi:TLC domain-containing protein [Cercophora scortea]|uniref:TLC domain-containing protein n=1 Tax=Cercophora scortea TaxID=314031 RepID=A0AAE0IZW9_9PEZI|nr:TLC domain-containing protein [Cercophora scortea]
MASSTGAAEPFPALSTSTASDAHHAHSNPAANDATAARRRRKSSSLGSQLRVGDTGAPSLGTTIAHLGGSKKYSKDGAAATPGKRSSKRRKARSALRRIKHFAFKHTWAIPLAILTVVLSLYAVNPTESNVIHRFIFLSYKLPVSSPDEVPQYGKGKWDFAFVSFYIVVLTFMREFVMQEVLRRTARWAGLKSHSKQDRYMEQMYTAFYFGILGPAGMYVMSRTPVWYFNTHGMYENFPHKTHEACFKFYYLFQAAYWAQQAIVLLLGMEKPRKDFKELVGHHIVSLALIALSYRFHFTYIGLAVYITHDISDFFLATSKSLNYVDHAITGPYYFLFMCVWIYLRHFLNLKIIFSLFTEFKTVGPYELNWETQQYKSPLAFYITLALLSSLQALNLFWLFFIIRIAYRFIAGNELADERSDAESEGEGEANDDDEDATPAPPALLANGGKTYAAAAVETPAAATANGSARKKVGLKK